METVTAADMAAYAHMNTNYWLYGHQALTEVAGMGNLGCVREMRHTFNSCTGLTEIDLSGLDPSSLENLAYTFSGCSSLVTIWADADWALPASGVSGFQTFYQCSSLVGGEGTTYASSRAGYQYMRVDGVGVPDGEGVSPRSRSSGWAASILAMRFRTSGHSCFAKRLVGSQRMLNASVEQPLSMMLSELLIRVRVTPLWESPHSRRRKAMSSDLSSLGPCDHR